MIHCIMYYVAEPRVQSLIVVEYPSTTALEKKKTTENKTWIFVFPNALPVGWALYEYQDPYTHLGYM